MRVPKKPIAPDYSNDAVFEAGDIVTILPPNLWRGCRGVVASVTKGLHRVIIMQENMAKFHADVRGNELKSVL